MIRFALRLWAFGYVFRFSVVALLLLASLLQLFVS